MHNAREENEASNGTDRNGVVVHRRKNARKAWEGIRVRESGEESTRINVSEEDQTREGNGGEEERGGDGAPEVDDFGLPKHVGGEITGDEAARRSGGGKTCALAARERSF